MADMALEAVSTEKFEALWENDTGDMTVSERACLIELVRRMFVTSSDGCWQEVVRPDNDKLYRDLSNLGLELVVDERLGVAWAAQVSQELRGKVPACRRQGMPERAHVAHAALCLRRHWDDCEMRGESDPHVTIDEVRGWVEQGPLAAELDGDGERLDKVTTSTVERLCRIGLIKLDRDAGTYRLLPTVLVLVSDEYCENIVSEAGEQDGNEAE